MRRGILWSVVFLVTGATVVAGVPDLRLPALALVLNGWAWAAPYTRTPAALGAGIGIAAGIASWSVLHLIARARDLRRRVRRLARPGTAVAGIARRTGLAQDAVRDLLASQAEVAEQTGTHCRAPAGEFAGILARNVHHDNELSTAARRPIARHAACPSGPGQQVPAFQTTR